MSRTCTHTLGLVRQCKPVKLQPCPSPFVHSHSHHLSRPFSSSQCRTDGSAKSSSVPTAKSDSHQMEKRRQEQLRSGEIPEDMGLMPDTFVMPSGNRRPPWTSQFRQRLRLERARLRRRFIDGLAITYYRFGWHLKPKPRLRLGEIPAIATKLHRSMYQHFAAGNLEPVRTSVIPGFLGKLRGRIAERPNRMPLRWRLHEYKSPPRLMSFKVALFPGPENEKKTERRGMVQAVVRIHSLQSLHHLRRVPMRDGKKDSGAVKEVLIDARGREISEAEYSEENARREAKELIEYVVLQKVLRKSKEGPWKIWGTTEETTLEKLERRQGRSVQDDAVAV